MPRMYSFKRDAKLKLHLTLRSSLIFFSPNLQTFAQFTPMYFDQSLFTLLQIY